MWPICYVALCARWSKAAWSHGAIAVRRTGEPGSSCDEFLRCSPPSSARMASVVLRGRRLKPLESNMVVVLPVVDYDAQRSLAAANVAAEVRTVRSLVNKFGKAQRAAEETLEMCDG